MKSLRLLGALLAVAQASESVFSVNDDVLAYPQYNIVYSESYITIENAKKKLKGSGPHQDPISSWEGDIPGQLARFHAQGDGIRDGDAGKEENEEEYVPMTLNKAPYLCTIPMVKATQENATDNKPEKKPETDLATAANRGWSLLQDMEGKPCLYYSTGWWSYSFCYNSQVKQFHALSPGTPGYRLWPPAEDPSTPSYVLGKFEPKKSDEKSEKQDTEKSSDVQEVAELQTKAETSYMVQRLSGGTACDLTGKPRKVEIQFHCNPQTTDRIGWIKETATCAYLMIVYTPRLCNDVAFLPPKDTRVNTISCQEVLGSDQVAEWEDRKKSEASRNMIDQGETQQRVMVGNIEVAAMKEVGGDGRRIERGRIVLTAEERAETVIEQKDGQIQSLSKADIRKLDLNPEDVDAFRSKLQEIAGSKDWKIERVDEPNGQIQLRGIVANEGTKIVGKKQAESEEADDGSEEEYKEEV